MSTILSPVSSDKQHSVFFDIFFASHQLLCDLAAKDTRACGRLQLEKIELDAALWLQTRTVRNSLEDLTISVQMAVLFVWDGTITVKSRLAAAIWLTPINKTERRVKNEHRRAIEQPHVKMYNQGMGGMDVCDRMLSSYQPRLRSRKCWWNLFSNSLNLSVVADFRFYSNAHRTKTTHRQFRREIARYLVKAEARLRLGGPTLQRDTTVRNDGVKPTLKSVSQDVFSAKKNTRP